MIRTRSRNSLRLAFFWVFGCFGGGGTSSGLGTPRFLEVRAALTAAPLEVARVVRTLRVVGRVPEGSGWPVLEACGGESGGRVASAFAPRDLPALGITQKRRGECSEGKQMEFIDTYIAY